jgi:hypothetical protein
MKNEVYLRGEEGSSISIDRLIRDEERIWLLRLEYA